MKKQWTILYQGGTRNGTTDQSDFLGKCRCIPKMGGRPGKDTEYYDYSLINNKRMRAVCQLRKKNK